MKKLKTNVVFSKRAAARKQRRIGRGNSIEFESSVSISEERFKNRRNVVDTAKESVYLTFVVFSQRYNQWKFASITTNKLRVRDEPELFDVAEEDNLTHIWERISVHGIMADADGMCTASTLKLIEYRVHTKDITKELIGDGYEKMLSKGALRPLDNEVINALGLQKEKAEQLLFHNPKFTDKDKNIIRHLESKSQSYILDI